MPRATLAPSPREATLALMVDGAVTSEVGNGSIDRMIVAHAL